MVSFIDGMNTVAVSFIVYTVAIMALGVYSARFSKRTSSDFFLAGRGLGAWVAALSSSASAESGWVTLGLVGMAFKTGLAALWIIPGTVAAFLFNWLVMANRLRKRSAEHDAITIPDMLAGGHAAGPARTIRILSVIVIVTMLTAYVAAQMTAAAKTFEETFKWNYQVGVLIGALIVLIYTVAGGFRAVAWTDVVQALFMVFATIVLPVVLIAKLGGFGPMLEALEKTDATGNVLDAFGGKTGMAMIGFFALWLGIPLGYPGQPHILVRFMATKDEQAIRRGTIISTAWVTVLFAGAVLLGVAARAYYGSLADPEKALPTAAVDFMPGLLAGVMIAAVMAAVCSTADSQLLVTASAVSHDLFVRFSKKKRSDRSTALVNRIVVLIVGVVAAAVAMTESRVIFRFVLYAWAGLGGAFGPALILTLLWKRTTSWGVIAGIVVGFVTTIVWVEAPVFEKIEYKDASGKAVTVERAMRVDAAGNDVVVVNEGRSPLLVVDREGRFLDASGNVVALKDEQGRIIRASYRSGNIVDGEGNPVQVNHGQNAALAAGFQKTRKMEPLKTRVYEMVPAFFFALFAVVLVSLLTPRREATPSA